MEAQQYGDEHPLDVSGLSHDQIMSLAGGRYADRINLCMQAAGWPTLHDGVFWGSRPILIAARELWVIMARAKATLSGSMNKTAT